MPSFFALHTPNEELRLPTELKLRSGTFIITWPLRTKLYDVKNYTVVSALRGRRGIKKKKSPSWKKVSICQHYESWGELLRPSRISALKHMRVRRYNCLALFYFIFSNSDYSVMNDHNHVFWLFFFSFGLNIHCKMEFNWHVMLYYAGKISFWKHA